MINERYSIAMAETLHYLKGIRKEDIDKIPNKFIKFLKENASQNYECKFDYTKSLKELEIMDETKGLISMICLNYWCDTEEKKINFKKNLNENEKKYQEELRKKYNIDDIFKKKEPDKKVEIITENIDTNRLPIQSEQQSVFQRVFNRIIKFFHIKVK